mmetsp:Transcript_1497/g.3568  ORF Transcript_1497/g.3568 Transcript_1497/m.3568 type:complete len:635 (-) Transcript_1497:67-1971(-)
MYAQVDPRSVALKEDSDDDDDRTDHEIQAGMAPRRCTDPICAALFIAALVGFVLLYIDALNTGDIRRLYHGYDVTGALCGVDPGVEGKPFLFYCAEQYESEPVALNTKAPICVASCPTGSTTSNQCYKSHTTTRGEPDENGSYVEKTQYNFETVKDYETKKFAGAYCIPDPNKWSALAQSFTDTITGTAGSSDKANYYLMELRSIGEDWHLLLAIALLATLLGYAYVFIVKVSARCLTYTALAVCTVAAVAGGIYFILASQGRGLDSIPNVATDNSTVDLVIGIALLLVGVLFVLLVCFAHEAIDTAAACVKAACAALFDEPSLLLWPFIQLVLKLVAIAVLVYGFLWVASCGDFAANQTGTVRGLRRNFSWTYEQYGYMVLYILGAIWILEVITALGQFVISYSVAVWYFAPYDQGGSKDIPVCPIFRALCIGSTFHLGSIALGAFLVSLVRTLKIIFGYIAERNKDDGNTIVRLVAGCCFFCLQCFENCIRFLNQNAYIDIAITSNSFCTAAREAVRIIQEQIATMAVLNGGVWIVSLAGYASITGMGFYAALLAAQNIPPFNDFNAEEYINDPAFFAVVAGVISFVIALAFMNIFDQAADTLLYCYAIDKHVNRGTPSPYAPKSLVKLLQS